MRFVLGLLTAIVLSVAPAVAEPQGVRVGSDIILEPMTDAELTEVFRTPQFVHSGDGVIGIWRFSYEEGSFDGSWRTIGFIVVSQYGEGVTPTGVRVWARGEITSGDSEGLIAAPLPSPSANIVAAFRVGLTRSRGAATITIDQDGVVAVDGQRLGGSGYD